MIDMVLHTPMPFTPNMEPSYLSAILQNICKLLLLIFIYCIRKKCLRKTVNLFEKVFCALVLFQMTQKAGRGPYCQQIVNGRSQKCHQTLREKCQYSEFFWSVFSHIRTEYREILPCISPYSVQMLESTDQKNSE